MGILIRELQYQTQNTGQLSVPKIYLGMRPLPLKGVSHGIRGNSIVRTDAGGADVRQIENFATLDKQAISNTKKGFRGRTGTKRKAVIKQTGKVKRVLKRVNGRFVK